MQCGSTRLAGLVGFAGIEEPAEGVLLESPVDAGPVAMALGAHVVVLFGGGAMRPRCRLDGHCDHGFNPLTRPYPRPHRLPFTAFFPFLSRSA